jgi:hypothetical protein
VSEKTILFKFLKKDYLPYIPPTQPTTTAPPATTAPTIIVTNPPEIMNIRSGDKIMIKHINTNKMLNCVNLYNSYCTTESCIDCSINLCEDGVCSANTTFIINGYDSSYNKLPLGTDIKYNNTWISLEIVSNGLFVSMYNGSTASCTTDQMRSLSWCQNNLIAKIINWDYGSSSENKIGENIAYGDTLEIFSPYRNGYLGFGDWLMSGLSINHTNNIKFKMIKVIEPYQPQPVPPSPPTGAITVKSGDKIHLYNNNKVVNCSVLSDGSCTACSSEMTCSGVWTLTVQGLEYDGVNYTKSSNGSYIRYGQYIALLLPDGRGINRSGVATHTNLCYKDESININSCTDYMFQLVDFDFNTKKNKYTDYPIYYNFSLFNLKGKWGEYLYLIDSNNKLNSTSLVSTQQNYYDMSRFMFK